MATSPVYERNYSRCRTWRFGRVGAFLQVDSPWNHLTIPIRFLLSIRQCRGCKPSGSPSGSLSNEGSLNQSAKRFSALTTVIGRWYGASLAIHRPAGLQFQFHYRGIEPVPMLGSLFALPAGQCPVNATNMYFSVTLMRPVMSPT